MLPTALVEAAIVDTLDRSADRNVHLERRDVVGEAILDVLGNLIPILRQLIVLGVNDRRQRLADDRLRSAGRRGAATSNQCTSVEQAKATHAGDVATDQHRVSAQSWANGGEKRRKRRGNLNLARRIEE